VFIHQDLLPLMAALARHELLSDIEQYGKELLPVTESQQK
jgi:hypothetical protein